MSFHMQQRWDIIPVAILITGAFLSHVTADFVLEVQVLTYSNPTHLASAFDGNCCDRSVIEISPPICIGVGTICDNSFSFCFREANGREDTDSEDDSKNNCTYGQNTTDLIQRNSDSLTFTVGEDFPGGVPNPVIATGQRWPGHIQLDIQIVDLDLGNTADDDVDLFLIDINVTSGINFSAPTTYNGMNGYGQIELRFRLSCTENYYGPDCATFCMEKNDEPGHYTCNSDRSIVCQPDYQDPITNCTMCIPAEGCSPTPSPATIGMGTMNSATTPSPATVDMGTMNSATTQPPPTVDMGTMNAAPTPSPATIGMGTMNSATTQPPATVGMGTSESQSTALVAGAVGGTVGLIVVVAVVAILLAIAVMKYKHSHAAKPLASFPNRDISVCEIDEPRFPTACYFDDGNALPPIPPFVGSSQTAKVNSQYQRLMSESNLLIPSRQIQLQSCIGKGEFGVVYRAHLIGRGNSTVPELVAVKTLKDVCSLKDVNELMEESLKMKALSHPNIINLIGVSVDAGDSPYIVMPYMANGSLLSYLRKERPNLTIAAGAGVDLIIPAQKDLLSICLQVVKGMEYLAEQQFIHRDLAARNCMIDANFVIKVADFGLSEDIYARNYFRQMKEESGIKLPIRWMALESLQDGIFTEKTDVWSFGVTCWEVFSLGKYPYPGVDPYSIVKFLENGRRLEKPSNAACSDEIYDVFLQCWNEHADKRPPFSDLVMEISKLLEEIAGYIDFSSISANGPQDENSYVKNLHGDGHLAGRNKDN